MSRHHFKLNRRKWSRARRLALDRDGWRCQADGCGRAGRLEVHHVKALDDGGEPFAIENLTTLCRNCHFKLTALQNEKPNPERDAWREYLRRNL